MLTGKKCKIPPTLLPAGYPDDGFVDSPALMLQQHAEAVRRKNDWD